MAGDALDFNHRPKPPTPADAINAPDRRRAGRRGAAPGRGGTTSAAPGSAIPARGGCSTSTSMSPRDAGRGFSGWSCGSSRRATPSRTWRSGGCAGAGFDLRTRDRAGEQFGFSVAGGRIQGHIDGVIVAAPAGLVAVPALWECKSANARNWREIVKRGVAAPSRSTRRRSPSTRPTWA